MPGQTVAMTIPDLLPLFAALAAYALLANGLAFAAFGLDKRRAQAGEWRIPENTLLLLAACGGWIGAKFGQHHYRDKTRKQPFGILLNLCGILIPAAAIALVLPVQQIATSAVLGLQQQLSSYASASGSTSPDPASTGLSSDPVNDTSITGKIGAAAAKAATNQTATGKNGKPHLTASKVGKAGKSTTAPATGPQRIGPVSAGKGLSQNFRAVPSLSTN